jgi:hypothetical protein
MRCQTFPLYLSKPLSLVLLPLLASRNRPDLASPNVIAPRTDIRLECLLTLKHPSPKPNIPKISTYIHSPSKPQRIQTKMRSSILAAATLLLAPFTFALDKPLNIETTTAVECTRKTVAGDKIDVHYRGTLESDGSSLHPLTRPNSY